MNRELLEKAKELDEKISKIDFVINMDSGSLFFYAENFDTATLNYKACLPKEVNDEIIVILNKYKEAYEKQLEEL